MYGWDTWNNNTYTLGYMRLQSMYGWDTWDYNPCTVGIHEIPIHVRSGVSWPYMDCYLMYTNRTWIVISCIPTVHGLVSHVSQPYMDCNLMYPNRTWIVISCIPTYMYCYFMYPNRTWVVISCPCTVRIHEITIHVRSGYMRYQSMYGWVTWDNNPCTVGIHEITIHARSGYMR
jgi:putative component of toxin-antitoxin plasmid stabilization module